MPEAQVRLRPITEADLPDYVEWLNDPEVTRFTQIEGPLTLEHEREWFRRVTAPESKTRSWAIEAHGRHIGNCALMPDESGETAGFGVIIGDKSQWGKGYGTAALREVLRIGFEEMGLRRVHLTAFAGNARGIRCYEKCGFRHEGVRRRHFLKRGRWENVVCMGILRDEWQATASSWRGEGLKIREFILSEYDDVAELWRAAELPPRPLFDNRTEIAKKLRRDPDLFLVALEGGRIVGTVIGGWDGRRGWIYRMAVHPDCQRRGIGRALMAEVEGRLRSKGALAINAVYNETNVAASSFYEAIGYDHRDGVGVMGKLLMPQDGEAEQCSRQ
jgi:RimJ/RimL family protein N-acetyltransferase